MKSNIILTILNRGFSAILNIVLIPLYIKFLGVESFGLIAFYSTLLGSLSLLDMGLSQTLSRELAIRSTKNDNEKETRNLIFSIELIYWGISVAIALSIFFFSDSIATHWIHAKNISTDVLQYCVSIMGIVIFFQWPISLYNGALIGLEKQKADNIISILFISLRSIGVFIVLNIRPSIEVFFLWQAFITFFYTLTLRYYTWFYLPKYSKRAIFSILELEKIWRFAAGVTGMSVIAFFITQIDKILVSSLVTLEQVGYYNIAFSVGGSLSLIVGAMIPIIYPRLVKIVTVGDKQELIFFFHKISKWMTIVSCPFGLFLFFFAGDILMIWTNNKILTEQVTPMLRVVSLGTLCNCAIIMPYNLLLSLGHTKYTIYQNIISVLFLVPLLFWLTNKFGAVGATFVWLVINVSYIFTYGPFIINKFLKGELMTWYLNDLIKPSAISLIIMLLIKRVIVFLGVEINLIAIILLFVVSTTLCFISIKESRRFLSSTLSQILTRYFPQTVFKS